MVLATLRIYSLRKYLVVDIVTRAALTGEGKIYCWGQNAQGQLGNNSTIQSNIPTPVDVSGVLASKTIVDVKAGLYHTIALDNDGKIYSWGYNAYGQLGNNTVVNSLAPIDISSFGALAGKIIAKIAAGGVTSDYSGAHYSQSAAIDSNGRLYVWGYNANGQVGDNTTVQRNVPTAVYADGALNGKTLKDVDVSGLHTIALDSNGQVYTWGYNYTGQLGNNTTTESATPIAISNYGGLIGKNIVSITADSNAYYTTYIFGHSSALDSNGKVYTWGYNGYGQLGDNTVTQRNIPTAVYTDGVLSGKVIRDVSSAGSHMLALDTEGQVYAWGGNYYGQLGDNTVTQRNAPIVVASTGLLNNKAIESVEAGGRTYHRPSNVFNFFEQSFALDSNGQLYSWGYNAQGQLGDNTVVNRSTAVEAYDRVDIPFDFKIDGIHVNVHTITPSSLMVIAPAHAAGMTTISVDAPSTDNRTLPNSYEYTRTPSPNEGLDASSFSIAPSSAYNTGGDTVTIVGANFQDGAKVKFGAVTTNTTFIDANTITAIVPASQQIGLVSMTIINPDGQSGEIQNAFEMKQAAPIVTNVDPTSGPTTGYNSITLNGSGYTKNLQFKKVSSGGTHSCGVTGEGKLYCWGQNAQGQLGNNSTIQSNIPTPVDVSGVLASKTIVDVKAGLYHTIALDNDGKIYSWGYNAYGQLGNNTVVNSLAPIDISSFGALAGKIIAKIAAGGVTSDYSGAHYSQSAAIDSNGRLYVWGYNANGQVGDNTTVQRNVPTAVYADGALNGKTLKDVDVSGLHTIALDSNGQVYTWGYNYTGQLGNNTTTESATPIAISNYGGLIGKNIVSITADSNAYYTTYIFGHSSALDSNGKVYTWGYNGYGQLGDNTVTQRNIPTAVYTDGVLSGKVIRDVSSAGSHMLALDTEGQVYAWGGNYYGQLGDNTVTQRNAPIVVASTGLLNNKAIESVEAGGRTYHRPSNVFNFFEQSFALDSNGQLYSWGYNAQGQLGDNTVVNRSTAVEAYDRVDIPFDFKIDGIHVNVHTITPSSLMVIAPAHAAGMTTISVDAPSTDNRTLPNSYEYTRTPSPNEGLDASSFSIAPSSAYNTGGDTVTIVGANFQDGAKVKFGAVTTNTTFIDANTITAIVPASQQIGLVSMTIINLMVSLVRSKTPLK
jgi:alpha-tubulin suppressor-like RCC1 family protein